VNVAADTDRFRAFNRTMTMLVGALDEHLLDSSYTLTEARVLFELGTRSPLGVYELREDLRLDPGYLSRILSSFEDRGLVVRRRAGHDARFQIAELTAAGKKVYRELDRRSIAANAALLGELSTADRERLLAATDDVRALLSGATAGVVELREARIGDFGWMTERHGVIYAEEYGFDGSFEGLVAGILGDFARGHDPTGERAWVAELDGRRAGAVLCVREDEDTARLRTLFVEPWARGHGIGTGLVEACVAFARAAGYRRMGLWTHDVLVDARRLGSGRADLGAGGRRGRRRLEWVPVKVLIAPDSFKGTLSAVEVTEALARGAAAAGASVDRCPLADGGEGTAGALLEAGSGRLVRAPARDPLGREIEGEFALLGDGATAVVEVAAASGLGLVGEGERDAEAASSRGTGELIAAAVAAGARRVLIGAGGSATTDGGAGCVAAIEAGGGLRGAELVVLSDVTLPWERAAAVFAPQKGASPAAVERLAGWLDALAATLPRDPRGVPRTGAAGGLSGGLWATYGARLVSGASWMIDALEVERRAAAADLLITGEGCLDAQTSEGKLIAELMARTGRPGLVRVAVAGRVELSEAQWRRLGLDRVFEAGDAASLERAAASAVGLLA
jgi:glycerate kinase